MDWFIRKADPEAPIIFNVGSSNLPDGALRCRYYSIDRFREANREDEYRLAGPCGTLQE